MRRIWLAVIALAAGLIGGVAGRALYPAPAPAPSAPSSLEARMEALETQVARLAGEIRAAAPGFTAPRADPAPATVPPEPVPPPEGPVLVPAADLEEKVRATVEEIAREAREERERQAAREQQAREEAWIAKTAADLGLTESQRAVLADVLLRRREYIAAYRARLAERGDAITPEERAALAREAEDYGRRLEDDLRAAFSTEQFEAFMRLRNPSNRNPGER